MTSASIPEDPPTRTRLRRGALAVVLAALLTGAAVTPAHATVDADAEARFVQRANQARAAAGLPGYAVRSDLTELARRHAARMAERGRIHHNSNLAQEMPGDWVKAGENVGVGPSVSSVHDALMDSSDHRANIRHADFTEVGVGVHVEGRRMWVTQVFRQPRSASREPEPEDPGRQREAEAEESRPSPEPSPEPSASEPSSAAAPEQPAPAEERAPAAAEGAPAAGDRADAATADGALDRGTIGFARLTAAETGHPVTELLGDVLPA